MQRLQSEDTWTLRPRAGSIDRPSISRGGAPGRIRTSDPQIRSLVLYPAELRAPERDGHIGGGSRARKPVAEPYRIPYAICVRVLFTPLLLGLLLAGCASGGTFPSLAPRPVEQLSMEEPIRVDPPVAADPAFRDRVSGLLGRARAGDAAFERAFARAASLAGAAGAANSDSWIQAQEALSRAEVARTETTAALADLDRLAVERADVPTNDSDHQALIEAHQAAQALANDQHRRLENLRARLGR